MSAITLTLTGREGCASTFVAGLAKETITLAGDLPALPAKLILFALDGTTLAVADLQADAETGAISATLDTDTQEIADVLRHQPLDSTTPAVILIGDADAIQARVPVRLRKNWLDDNAAHPPAPAAKYWTTEETQAAIAEATRFGGGSVDVLNEEADNWNAAWGFRLDLRTLRPDAFPVPGRAGARVLNIQLVSSSKADAFADPKTVHLRIEASDGTSATSSNAHAFDAPQKWCNFAFAADGATGAWLPDATLTARFVDAATGEDAAVPIRLGPVGEQPDGTALIVSAEGAERGDLIPYLNTLKFVPVGPSFADAIAALQADKQNNLTAGQNITISPDGTISATGADPETEERVAALEAGRGIYKDPKTGEISVYTPCPECSDGTLKVVIDMGIGAKILPVEEADTYTMGAHDDGETIFLMEGDGDISTLYGINTKLYVYGLNSAKTAMARRGKKTTPGWWGYGETLRYSRDYSGQMLYLAAEDALYFVGNDATIRKTTLADDAAYLARVSNSGGNPLAIWHNPLTGHICHLRYQSSQYLIRVFDLALNRVGDADIDVTDICASAKLPTSLRYASVGRKHVFGRAWVYCTATTKLSATVTNAALLVATDSDGLAIAHEATLQEDPERPGYVLCEHDESGALIQDHTGSALVKPVTTEGPEIRFNVAVEAERDYAANAWRAMPHFQFKQLSKNYKSPAEGNKNYILTDAIDSWLILSDGRLVRMDEYQFASYSNWRTTPPTLKAKRTGEQKCLTATGVTAVFACGRGEETWASMPHTALLASGSRYLAADGLTQNLAIKPQADGGYGQTDGVLPFWPRFGYEPYFNAAPPGCPFALIGAPAWLVSYASVGNRIL